MPTTGNRKNADHCPRILIFPFVVLINCIMGHVWRQLNQHGGGQVTPGERSGEVNYALLDWTVVLSHVITLVTPINCVSSA